jgi:hypothetical protein
MAISLVQSASKQDNGVPNTTLAFDVDVTAGNCLIVVMAVFQSGGLSILTTPTDTLGHTYTGSSSGPNALGGNVVMRYWYVLNCSGGANTVTFDIGEPGNADFSVAVSEWSGVKTSSAVDGIAAGQPTSATPALSDWLGNEANELYVAFLTHDGNDTTITEESGWTTLEEFESGTSAMPLSFVYKIQTASGADGHTWTLGASRFCAVDGVAFKAAPAGGVSVTPAAASLSLTGFAPSVIVNTILTPAAASLAITAFAPSVVVNTIITPAAASLTLTGFAPTVLAPVVVTPGAASLTLTGFAPTVTVSGGVTLTPGAATLTLTTFAPTVLTPVTVVPAAASLTLTAFAPTVLTPVVVTPAAATLTLTAFAPTVLAVTSVTLTPQAATLTLTTFAPIVSVSAPASAIVNLLAVYAPVVVRTAEYGPVRGRATYTPVIERAAIVG